jgi:hypothetical protein
MLGWENPYQSQTAIRPSWCQAPILSQIKLLLEAPPTNYLSFYTNFNRQKNKFSFEVFTAMAMMNTVFWDVAPRRFIINRRFGGNESHSTLKMEATCSSETYV